MRPSPWLPLIAGVLLLIVATVQFLRPVQTGAGVLGRYHWVVWLLAAGVAFVRAWRKPARPPEA